MANSLPCRLLCKENIRQFVDSFDTVLTDCDGVLWHGNTPIAGAVDTINKLKKMGKRIFYISNNSTKTRGEYVEKCTKMGFPAKEENMVGSAYATAQYIKHQLKLGSGKVFIVGSTGISRELDAVGIKHCGVGPDIYPDTPQGYNLVAHLDLDPQVKCVVVGLDWHFSYPKLARAISYLSDPKVHFIITNTDSGLPMGPGKVLPGTGALAIAVETAAQRKADIICGKPARPIFDILQEKFKVQADRTVMFGDRLDTDIQFAGVCGLQSLLVLTGFSTIADLQSTADNPDPTHQKRIPTYLTQTLGDIGNFMEQGYSSKT